MYVIYIEAQCAIHMVSDCIVIYIYIYKIITFGYYFIIYILLSNLGIKLKLTEIRLELEVRCLDRLRKFLIGVRFK